MKKQIAPDEIEAYAKKWHEMGKTIVTLNGSFDLLHAGHLQILKEAKSQGDILLVALNSDVSIKGYKGPERPIIPLEYRLEMMAALECVDFVTYFDELTPLHFLEKVKPHVHVNGAEYGEECIEAETVRQHGGKIHIVPLKPGLSTSAIIERIISVCV